MSTPPLALMIDRGAAALSEGAGCNNEPGIASPGRANFRATGPRRWSYWRTGVRVAVALVLLAALGGCGSGITPQASYKPELLPFKINVSASGIALEGDTSIITPIGEFSIGAQYALPERDEGTIYVVLRDRKKGSVGYDTVYKVRAGKDDFSAVVNGTTAIEVHNGQVIIDVTNGTVSSIQLKRSGPGVGEQSAGDLWGRTVQRWQAGYDSSWYHPFMLARWAYDDSTISRWFGIGFVWFLIRLVLAILLCLVDLLLSLVFVVAQVVYLFAGSTGRNIVWGLFVLALAILIISGLVALNE
jgi:hypothetical protein